MAQTQEQYRHILEQLRRQPTEDYCLLYLLRVLALQRTCDEHFHELFPSSLKTIIWGFLKPVVVDYVRNAVTVAGGQGFGSHANQLNFPHGLAVAQDGTLFVADTGNHRVQQFAPGSLTGVTVAGGRGQGSGADQLSCPQSIAVRPDGALFVADTDNSRVQCVAPGSMVGFTVAGGPGGIACPWSRRLHRAGGEGGAADQLDSPFAVAVAPDGACLVLDWWNCCVRRFTPNDMPGATVAGGHGPGGHADQLLHPTGLAVALDGTLFVADLQNHRVQQFVPGSLTGVTVAGGCGLGNGADQLMRPQSIAVRPDGALLVASHNGRVQCFAPGSMVGVTVADGSGGAADQLGLHIAAVTIAPDGACLVSDCENCRVQRFSALFD